MYGARGINLLVVENDLEDYYIVKELLQRDEHKNYKMTQVGELSEAIEILSKDSFDVILLDLGLDDSSGLQTLKELAAVVDRTPIVVLTGVDDPAIGEQAIQIGAEDYVAKNGISSSLLNRVISYAIERHRLLVKIKRQAEEDALTKLPNRSYLCDTLETLISQSERNTAPLAVAMLDLDGFKSVNDNYGHHAGDELLIKVAERLRQRLRKSDVVGRWGGDEFVILITNYGDHESLLNLVENKKNVLIAPYFIDISGVETEVAIGVSIGLVEWRLGMSMEQLIDLADRHMYVSKSAGKSQVDFAKG